GNGSGASSRQRRVCAFCPTPTFSDEGPSDMPIRPPPITRRALATLAGAGLAATGARAQADDYPNRPVTIIVPFTPGGAADTAGRVIAKGLSERLGQSFVVENRPGGGSTLGAGMVA